MTKTIKHSLIATIALASLTTSAMANDKDTIDYENKLSQNYTIADEMRLDGEMRLRYNQVDTGVANEGKAFTNRLLINAYWQPKTFEDTTIKASFNNVSNFGAGAYNNYKSQGDKPQHATINDSAQTRLTELNAKIKNVGGDGTLTIGRQVSHLDDGRFVSKVNDRQMYRTYDSINYSNEVYQDLVFNAFYSTRMHSEVNSMGNDSFHVSLRKDFMENGSYIRIFDIATEDTNNIMGIASRLNFGMVGENDLSLYGAYAYQGDSVLGDDSGLDKGSYFIGAIDYEFIKGFSFGASYELIEEDFTNVHGNNYKYGTLASQTSNNGGGSNLNDAEVIGVNFKMDTDEIGTLGLGYKMLAQDSSGDDIGNEIAFSWSYDYAKNINVSLSTKSFSSDVTGVEDITDTSVALTYKF